MFGCCSCYNSEASCIHGYTPETRNTLFWLAGRCPVISVPWDTYDEDLCEDLCDTCVAEKCYRWQLTLDQSSPRPGSDQGLAGSSEVLCYVVCSCCEWTGLYLFNRQAQQIWRWITRTDMSAVSVVCIRKVPYFSPVLVWDKAPHPTRCIVRSFKLLSKFAALRLKRAWHSFRSLSLVTKSCSKTRTLWFLAHVEKQKDHIDVLIWRALMLI